MAAGGKTRRQITTRHAGGGSTGYGSVAGRSPMGDRLAPLARVLTPQARFARPATTSLARPEAAPSVLPLPCPSPAATAAPSCGSTFAQ